MVLPLRLANDLPSDPIRFIAERILSHGKPDVWLWADTHATGYELLKQLRDELGDEADRLVKSHHALYLRKGGQVLGMIPKERPDGEKRIAIWMATSSIPSEYMRRFIFLGQCEEFWARPGSVPMWQDGSDWRKGD